MQRNDLWFYEGIFHEGGKLSKDILVREVPEAQYKEAFDLYQKKIMGMAEEQELILERFCHGTGKEKWLLQVSQKLFQLEGVGCSDAEKLELYERLLEEESEFPLEELQRKVLENIPLNDEKIGIYGVGEHTLSLLDSYQKLVGEINADLIFIDTKQKSHGEVVGRYELYNVRDLYMVKLDASLTSSALYEDTYPIYCIYEEYPKRIF